MNKSELKQLIREVVSNEVDVLKEDMVNMLSVILAELQENKKGNSIVEENYTGAKPRSGIEQMFSTTTFSKIGVDAPKQREPNRLKSVLLETLKEGDWRNMEDIGQFEVEQ